MQKEIEQTAKEVTATKSSKKTKKEEVFKPTLKDLQKFIPDGYEIQYDAEGDLNQDKIPDYVCVLKHVEDFTSPRPTLVFLGNKDKSIRLMAKSDVAFPLEYIDGENKNFEYEYIQIKDHKLSIDVSGMGAAGSYTYVYELVNENLFLASIHSFDQGAGGQTVVNYDVLRGKYVIENTNTMEDDMPTETENIQKKSLKLKFEEVNPIELLMQN
ncbi:hypothetical protein JJC03_04865 [Flavobacterium oreochromis]|uniref:hypothetical protein n=1 Tax=Flavobacterium oreochromis TaxID=2906078 RepID=UPI001CE6D077|nr:hypothetical protein [Flavobacterium oreochromis]QYS87264.1 hypothetical protein JJC03_04865 [Flavobacterium oreochromis]